MLFRLTAYDCDAIKFSCDYHWLCFGAGVILSIIRIFLFACLSVLCSLAQPISSFASDNMLTKNILETTQGAIESWENDKLTLEKLAPSTPEGCNQIFNILWDWSKKGNLAAKRSLLMYMTMFEGPYMTLPAPTRDDLSRHRHYVILALHSIDTDLNDEGLNYLRDIYLMFGPRIKPSGELDECIKTTKSKECVVRATKSNEIPSFEMFSKEIDLAIDAGYKAMCAKKP